MPISAEYNVTQETRQIYFGPTVIDWDLQEIRFHLKNAPKKWYDHKLTEAQWNYLTNGLQTLMNNIPQVDNVTIPDFDPDM